MEPLTPWSVKTRADPASLSASSCSFGFWSMVPLAPGETDGTHNRKIEQKVQELGGRKSLYSTSFYAEDEFWSLYGGEAYALLKKEYDPQSRLLDLYAKTVRRH